MSKSIISCRRCHEPIAYRHHSGRIPIEPGVRVVRLPDGKLLLTCTCGEQRLIAEEPRAA